MATRKIDLISPEGNLLYVIRVGITFAALLNKRHATVFFEKYTQPNMSHLLDYKTNIAQSGSGNFRSAFRSSFPGKGYGSRFKYLYFKISKLRFIVILLLFSTSACFSQQAGMVNYTQENGLNASHIYRLAQDTKGYIWMGTDNGLFRFDGAAFKRYGRQEGLKNIEILEPVPMSNGGLFIVPFLNEPAFMKDGKIISSDNSLPLKKAENSNTAVTRIELFKGSHNGRIAFADVKNPSLLFVADGDKIRSYPVLINSGDTNKKAYEPVEYDLGEILFIRKEETIYSYNINTQRIDLYQQIPNYLADFQFKCIEEGTGIFTSGNTFYLYNRRQKKISEKHTAPSPVYWASKAGNLLWLGMTEGGACCYNLQNDPYLKSPVIFLKDYIVNGSLTDSDGNAWFTTKNNGIFFMEKNSFNSYMKTPLQNNEGSITSITGNENTVVAGYSTGEIGLYKNNKLEKFTLHKGRNYEVRNIITDGNDAYFISASFSRFNITSKTITDLPQKLLIAPKMMVPYKIQSVLICSYNGLREYNFKEQKETILTEERTYTALPYSDDSIFAGSFKDLYKFNTITKEKKLFLEGYYFTDIKKISKDLFIGASNGNGLFIFNNAGILKHISEKDGLLSGQVTSVYIENEDTYWASGNSGLCKIHLSNNRFTIMCFTAADGLPSERVSGCFIRNDTLFAGTAKGLGIIAIKDLMKQQQFINKRVLINTVKANGMLYSDAASLKIIYPLNNLVFDLSFPDYASRGHVAYRYKIEGLNNEWQTGNSSRIIINALPPGKYTIKVFGVGYNGKLSKEATEFQFEIMPRYWQTTWFLILCIVLISILLLFISNQITRSRRNKKLKNTIYEKKIAELELQAIKAQVNPHFIYNCLNSIKFLLYKKDYPQTENYLDVFAQMIRKTLHYSEKTFMPLAEEIEYLELYLAMEKMRFNADFNYSIRAAENVNLQWKIPSLLIQPFAENAVKHGIAHLQNKKGMVDIAFEYAAPYLSVTVTDNGPGISNIDVALSKEGSFGIKLLYKRIETFRQLFNTEIRLSITGLSESGGQGTEIKLFLRLNDQDQSKHNR